MLWYYLHFSRNPWAVVTVGGTCRTQAQPTSSENVGEISPLAVAEALLKGACKNTTCTWRERTSGFLAFSKKHQREPGPNQSSGWVPGTNKQKNKKLLGV